MKKMLIFLLLVLLAVPLCYGQEGSMKLLAASPDENATGSTADLRLEIVPGTGRVYIETFPITKLDTQISTRFAKEVACDFLDADCSKYNFFYTIKSRASIIGGPSASSAIAVLTAAMLENIPMNRSIAMTGTINSGGLIGPVGGLQAKIEAASLENITTVLIPRGERNVTKDNKTIDLVLFGRTKGINVIEVARLNEALTYFTGKNYEKPIGNITISPMYNNTMASISQGLCNKTTLLLSQVLALNIPSNDTFLNDSLNLTQRANAATEQKRFYSAASSCYGANVKLRYLLLKSKNTSSTEIITITYKIKNGIFESQNNLDAKKLETINDLQAAMVVRERLIEADENLDNVLKSLKENNTDEAMYSLANGIERLTSAASWSNFFNKGGRKFNIDKNSLMESCVSKIGEASERLEYIKMMTSLPLNNTQKELDYAYNDYAKGNYELCLFTASKAKAEADILISLLGVSANSTDDFIELKLELARENILRQTSKGIFPILGYSYYEYADTLKKIDPGSALLYVEYALELSNVDIYFKQQNSSAIKIDSRVGLAISFIVGLILGITVTLLGKKSRRPKSKKK